MYSNSDMICKMIREKGFTLAQVAELMDDCKTLYANINLNRWTKRTLKKVGDIIGADLSMWVTSGRKR